MELRFCSARATKDIDLTCLHRIKNVESPIEALILHELRQLVKIDLGDYFNFEISSAQMDLENAPYGGSRYSVSSLIDRRLFVRFQLDIGADAILDNIENIDGSDWLKYCGIKAPKIKMISVEQQLAEKIHAYTFPRENRLNSKVKDLVHMLLLIELRKVDIEDFKKIIKNVFRTRKTHMLPSFLNPPP